MGVRGAYKKYTANLFLKTFAKYVASVRCAAQELNLKYAGLHSQELRRLRH